ncbi:hypothetical protein Acr_28g0008790 [Actinidia rufa]|uniref:Uncharacterized protein n=1 Tax=Actinidia rufa TaxID=165716 RepID=A0A7J0HBP4_9ERIC|nr:hypothetical protein Acr_28g0008790 [Actinidia rufa]
MKRSRHINARDPPKMRSSSVTGLNGVQSYVETEDEIRAKKVRFSDPEHDCLPNVRPNVSHVQHIPSRDSASNVPKTSEYAFFKKLKKDAGCCRSYTSNKEDDKLKKFESSGCTKGISTMFKSNCDNITPSLLIEKATPTTHNLFLSPDINASNNLEAANTVEQNMHKDIRSPSFAERVKPIKRSLFLSPLGVALKNSGNEYLDEEVFSGKREKLRQWVAKTSLSEVEELWCDLVSMLISRLFPDGDENNSCRAAKPMPMQRDTKYLSSAAPESDIYDKEYHWTDSKDLLKAEHGWYLDDFCDRPGEIIPSKWDTKASNSPSTSYASNNHFQYENKEFGCDIYDKEYHWTDGKDLLQAEHDWYLDDFCDRPREIIPSKWDTKASNSPSTSYASNNHFQYENKEFGFDYKCRSASLITTCDPYAFSDVENYGYTASTYIKELDKFQDLDDSADGREPCGLLLGWDFDNLKDRALSITSRNADMNLHKLAASWDVHQQSLDDSFDAHDLPPSSFFLNYPSKFIPLPHPHSENFCNWEAGRFLEEEKFLVTELKHLPLSRSLKFLNLRENYNTYNLCEDRRIVSPQHHHWVISKVFSEKLYPDLEAYLFPSGLGFDLGWKCLSKSGSFNELNLSTYNGSQSPLKENPCSYLLTEEQHEDCSYSLKKRQGVTCFAEDTLDSHEWSSINFQIPIDKGMAHPLPHDSSSWLRPDEVIDYDDDVRIYI